ncbi:MULTISPECIES: Rho termination factor N-terminal domain-containing protein [unclassified Streptomyces]|uniref:Rho termination factor N-terminal domain-containing protein n=1 Tax=unclassified Streptomyces TaxID=2593676 RepID=UPI001BEB2FC7|nr:MULTISPECIES: Rho termination factor N-terminal domain-containing protein [unclassified Streptomyces]MBT2405243.1 hypothetical protein [Streptomyces sp. ISL-21]MBT2611011.1 hypothetical protein [Streptomyces sp. ISL-87]
MARPVWAGVLTFGLVSLPVGMYTATDSHTIHCLIDALTMTWDPEAFRDTFREKVAQLIEAKQAGETVEKAEPAAKSTHAVDLMETLRASVERARSPKDTGEKATAPGARHEVRKRAGSKPAAKKRVRSAPTKHDLESLTKSELYEKAAAATIPGRSTMTRDELIKALTRKHQAA